MNRYILQRYIDNILKSLTLFLGIL